MDLIDIMKYGVMDKNGLIELSHSLKLLIYYEE